MKNSKALAITLLYLILACIGISHHELWLDEAQHILLGRDSHSIGELLYNARYEGHPLLWNVLVYFIIHLFHTVLSVQITHILISSACVFLILNYSPFSLLTNLLICFGYFMFFEYVLISRNYSLSLLFILLVIINMSKDKKNYSLLFILLAFLANTHTFSAIISVVLMLLLWKGLRHQKIAVQVVCLLFFLMALCFCLLRVIPPGDHFLTGYNTAGIFSSERFSKIPRMLIAGMLPIPDMAQPNYWSHNYISGLNKFIIIALSAALFCIPALFLYTNKKALFLFYAAASGILLFTYFTPLMPAARHGGFISMLLMAACWLKKAQAHKNNAFVTSTWLNNTNTVFFGMILTVQFITGPFFFYSELTRKFSNAKTTAEFINTNFSNETTGVALSHFTSGPAVALFCKHTLFYMEENENGTFCKWNTRPLYISDSTFIARLKTQLNRVEQIVLINNQPNTLNNILNSNLMATHTIKQVASFNDGMIKAENFTVYLLQKR